MQGGEGGAHRKETKTPKKQSDFYTTGTQGNELRNDKAKEMAFEL